MKTPTEGSAASLGRRRRVSRARKAQAAAYCGVLLGSVGRKPKAQNENENENEKHRMHAEVRQLQQAVGEMQQQVQAAALAIRQLHGLVVLLAAQS